MKCKIIETQNGLTLIALVITVIVLLIIAGAAISIGLNGENVFKKSQESKEGWNSKVAQEEVTLNNYINTLDNIDLNKDNSIVSIRDGYILRSNGILSVCGIPEVTDGEMVEVNENNLDEQIIATDVKKLFYNNIFLTKSNKLCNESPDNVIIENVKCIVSMHVSDNSIYYINTNNELVYFKQGREEIIDYDVDKVRLNSSPDIGEFFYTKANGTIIMYVPGETNVEGRIIRRGKIDLTQIDKYIYSSSDMYARNKDGKLYSFLNPDIYIENGKLISMQYHSYQFTGNIIDNHLNQIICSHEENAIKWRVAKDDNNNLYLISSKGLINLSNDNHYPMYGKNISKIKLEEFEDKIVIALLDDEGNAYCAFINPHMNLNENINFITVNSEYVVGTDNTSFQVALDDNKVQFEYYSRGNMFYRSFFDNGNASEEERPYSGMQFTNWDDIASKDATTSCGYVYDFDGLYEYIVENESFIYNIDGRDYDTYEETYYECMQWTDKKRYNIVLQRENSKWFYTCTEENISNLPVS